MNNYYLGSKGDLKWMERSIERVKIMSKLFYDYIFDCDTVPAFRFVKEITDARFTVNPQCRTESDYFIYTDFDGNIYLSTDIEFNNGLKLVVVTYEKAAVIDHANINIYGFLGKEFFENFCELINKNCFQNTKERS